MAGSVKRRPIYGVAGSMVSVPMRRETSMASASFAAEQFPVSRRAKERPVPPIAPPPAPPAGQWARTASTIACQIGVMAGTPRTKMPNGPSGLGRGTERRRDRRSRRKTQPRTMEARHHARPSVPDGLPSTSLAARTMLAPLCAYGYPLPSSCTMSEPKSFGKSPCRQSLSRLRTVPARVPQIVVSSGDRGK